MISFILWLAIAAGVFSWNFFIGHPFLGVRFTQRLLGYPLNGGWLALGVALYCLVRWWRRRGRPTAD